MGYVRRPSRTAAATALGTLLLPGILAAALPSHSIRAFIPMIEPTTRQGARSRAQMRRYVSERQVPQYTETMKLFTYNGTEPIEPQVFTPDDFESYLGDEKLVGKGGELYKLIHKSKSPLVSDEECQNIIDECEEYAQRQAGWTSRRHFAYATTDLPLQVLPRTRQWFQKALERTLYPALACNFRACLPDPQKLRVVDAFVVKYDADGGQTQLKPHRDGSVVSFNIALNPADEYEGGGTYFKGLDSAIKLEKGHVVTHASNVMHGGHPITSGRRYILVAFVIVEGYQNFAMRFANQVWNY